SLTPEPSIMPAPLMVSALDDEVIIVGPPFRLRVVGPVPPEFAKLSVRPNLGGVKYLLSTVTWGPMKMPPPPVDRVALELFGSVTVSGPGETDTLVISIAVPLVLLLITEDFAPKLIAPPKTYTLG